MKLRIRPMATRETIRITAPDAASLLDLKSLIAASLVAASTNPNPDPIAPDSIHLSLNQLDELVAPNASDPLSALGLTSALLDMGFTLFNGAGSKLPQGWALHASSLSLEYTIPDFVNQVQAINERVAVTKLSVLGNLVTVYGYLGGIKPDIYRFSLDLAKVASLLSLNLKSMCKSEQEQLMEIFRSVKDGVALPLMIDLCLKNGLPLPPCFMFLSIDIRAKILDLLSGADVVRTGSTCKEMRNLSLDDNLWRQKFEREFSNSLNNNISMPAGTWKERYKSAYIAKNSASRFRTRRSNWFQIRPSVAERPIGPGGHFILGGNADRFPVFGAGIEEVGPIAFRRRGPDGRQVSPRCFTEN
ncbi:F-box protein SKIP22 [Rhynchospora pubera]|uniref:F-box protein SKIP22 n=1 Tax=Rhynchospora pubera TaxID=906938 RepID=A0AAV8DJZ9_9POAL|nr:F-box protein SKIP22 [Rhynchospora pubera]